jgi:hypothetical protein
MEPLDLHYSRFKLIRLVFYALLGAAAMLWVATGGISDPESGHGRGAWIGRLLGAEGLRIMGWVSVVVTAGLALLYLRRAFADPVAARADSNGLTIHTLFGTHVYALRDIDRIELRRPAGQYILQVVPLPGQGKSRGLAVNGLTEDSDEVEAWIVAVRDVWRPGSGV